ncbi:MAG: KamA2, partial [uncultured bacterium]
MKEILVDRQVKNFTDDNLPDCFKDVSQKQWNDWQWQRDNSLRIYHNDSLLKKQEILKKITDAVSLPTGDVFNLDKVLRSWDMLITPHQILQIRRKLTEGDKESSLALFKTVNPSISEGDEYQQIVKLKIDGLGTGYRRKERYNTPENPQPREIRRLYDDRVVLTCTWQCPTGCRYCFRRPEALIGPKVNWEKGLNYIKKWNLTHSKEEQVKDVILSGGDPLFLSDNQIKKIAQGVKSIPGVKFLRIDTKYLAAMPQRITPELAEILGKYVDLMCFHFTHPAEIS